MAKVLRVNKAKCGKCGTVIQSVHRHDFVRCKCGAIYTDGGTSYIRRGGDPENIIDMSVWEEMPDDGTTKIGDQNG